MRILIDADGCPVVDLTIGLAQQFAVEVLILCDTAHLIEREGASTLTFAKGKDSVDFALVNLLHCGDIVITQDYGLAAMCLAKKALVINQNGLQYTADNIDSLLLARHTAKKVRRSGGKLKGPRKRDHGQDIAFEQKLLSLLQLYAKPVQDDGFAAKP